MKPSTRMAPSRSFQTALLAGLMLCATSFALALPGPGGAPVPQARQDRTPAMLTDEDIELIKVYEVNLQSDPPPRVAIARDVLREFLDEYKENDRIPRGKKEQEDWLRADGHKQLDLMFKLQARSYYKKVSIKSQVESLRSWQKLHSSYILGYFRDHFGDGDVKGLYLFPHGRESERIAMTNFFILTQVSIDGKPLIDRNNPSESLILQWGLPRESAKFAAPDVPNWRPQFKDTQDKRFVEIVEWIQSLVRVNQGQNYDIKFRIPGQEREQPSN